MNWAAMADVLDITTEMRPVYRAGTRGFLTKDAAIRDAIKGIARQLDQCLCDSGDADFTVGRGTPPDYCGCQGRIAEMIEVLTPIAKRLPDSQAEWEEKTSAEFWESYEFGKEEETRK